MKETLYDILWFTLGLIVSLATGIGLGYIFSCINIWIYKVYN